MRATLYQHPSAPVTFDGKPFFDPREQPVTAKSVAQSIDAANQERAKARAAGATNLKDVAYPEHVLTGLADEYARLDAIEAIHRLMDRYGVERVSTWVENAARLRGSAIEGV